MSNIVIPPRFSIALSVLEMAKDAGDEMVIRACRECLNAWRLGHKAAGSYAIVREFYDAA